MAKSVVLGKRIVGAKCKLCGRVYWHFSDVEPWSAMERRLQSHVWYHVSKEGLTPEQAKYWQKHFNMVWIRVYDPSKINMLPEQFEALHPQFISLQDYEGLKLLAQTYPPGMVQVIKKWFGEKD